MQFQITALRIDIACVFFLALYELQIPGDLLRPLSVRALQDNSLVAVCRHVKDDIIDLEISELAAQLRSNDKRKRHNAIRIERQHPRIHRIVVLIFLFVLAYFGDLTKL